MYSGRSVNHLLLVGGRATMPCRGPGGLHMILDLRRSLSGIDVIYREWTGDVRNASTRIVEYRTRLRGYSRRYLQVQPFANCQDPESRRDLVGVFAMFMSNPPEVVAGHMDASLSPAVQMARAASHPPCTHGLRPVSRHPGIVPRIKIDSRRPMS